VKPAAFDYHRPRSVADALDLLADLGDAAKVLAGGQSLVPLMNFRLARPRHLVDLNYLHDLADLSVVDGWLCIGAMTRQRAAERSPLLDGWPLLRDAIQQIGHPAIRTRGTVGGSLAHADPAAELPAAVAALDAELLIRGRANQRTVRPAEFFRTYLTTVLRPDELLVEVRCPPQPPRTGWAFQEISRRHGDFALVGVAALLTLDERGLVGRARLAFTGAGDVPLRAAAAERALVGEAPHAAIVAEAARLAAAQLDPPSDVHASASYRREVAEVLARRALSRAAERARLAA
jgi:CO/xanthine dehydrogenase FAD-binding subunit